MPPCLPRQQSTRTGSEEGLDTIHTHPLSTCVCPTWTGCLSHPLHIGVSKTSKSSFTPAGTLEQGGPISGSSQVSRKCSKRRPVLTINLLPWALSFSHPGWPLHPVEDRMLPPVLCTGNHSSHPAPTMLVLSQGRAGWLGPLHCKTPGC